MTNNPQTGTRPWGAYVIAVLLPFVASAGVTTLYSMQPTLYREFGGRHVAGWTVTAYFLVAAISAALCGRLGDLLGRRFISLVVLTLAATGALLSTFSQSAGMLIVGCALQGTAAALVPLAIGLVRELLDERRVPVAVGIIIAAANAGAGIVYLIAGVVIDRFASRGGFLFKVALALVAIIALLVLTRKPARPAGSLRGIDLLHGALFAPAIAALLLVVDRGTEWGLGDLRTLACLLFGIGLLVYWVRHQLSQAKPLIDVRLLTLRKIALANLAMVLLAISSLQLGQVFALFLQQPVWTGAGFGFTATVLGWYMLANNSVAVIFAPLAGVLARRQGSRRVAVMGAAVGMLSWLLLGFFHQTLLQTAIASVLGLVGLSLLYPALSLMVVESVPEERTSEASGVIQVALLAFMGVGSQFIYRILASDTVSDAARDTATYSSNSAFTWVFIYLAAGSFGSLLMVMAQRRGARAAKK